MTVFDYVVLGVLGLSLLLGTWRGFVGELLALVAWVVAFFVAREGAVIVAPMLTNVVADAMLRSAAAFVLVFVAVLVLVSLVRLMLRELLRAIGLGILDRMLGAVFGILRGVVLVFAGVLIAGLTNLPRNIWWQDAMLSPPLETAVLAAKPWLPGDVAKRIRYR